MTKQETFRIVTNGADLIIQEGEGRPEIALITEDDEIGVELDRESIKELIKALTDLL